jgi:hypothetical protein
MLLNVAAHNISIRNIKVSKHERHIMYSITKCTASQNIKCTLRMQLLTGAEQDGNVNSHVITTLSLQRSTELGRC